MIIKYDNVLPETTLHMLSQAMNASYRQKTVAGKTDGFTLDIGSYFGVTGGLRKFQLNKPMKTISCDVDVFNIDYFVRCTGEHLPFRAGIFNTVVIAEVFEHREDWEAIYHEAKKMTNYKMVVSVPDARIWTEWTLYNHEAENFYQEYEKHMQEVRDNSANAVITEDKLFKHQWHVHRTRIGDFINVFDKDFVEIKIETTDMNIVEGGYQFRDLPYIIFTLRFPDSEFIGNATEKSMGLKE